MRRCVRKQANGMAAVVACLCVSDQPQERVGGRSGGGWRQRTTTTAVTEHGKTKNTTLATATPPHTPPCHAEGMVWVAPLFTNIRSGRNELSGRRFSDCPPDRRRLDGGANGLNKWNPDRLPFPKQDGNIRCVNVMLASCFPSGGNARQLQPLFPRRAAIDFQ